MTKSDRLKRPVPERTKPKRGVLGALGQSDAMLGNGMDHGTPDTGGHPLGPGFADAGGADPLGLIDEGVRAASDLVDAHIRQGEETAARLGKATGAISAAQGDVTGLLTGLVRAYSDVASVWVDIVGSLAHKLDGSGQAKAEAPAASATLPAPGLSIASEGRVEASIEMFRPAPGVTPQPLIAQTAEGAAQITDVSFQPGMAGTAGMIRLSVPGGQPPGTYHGMLLSTADQRPAGVITLTVLVPEAAP